jgi:hypothetical protein
MTIALKDIQDSEFEDELLGVLINDIGVDARKDGDLICIDSVSTGSGDGISLTIDLVKLNDHRTLMITNIVAKSSDRTSLLGAAAVANDKTFLPKFDILNFSDGYALRAVTYMYADHLSTDELTAVLATFVAEVDQIDNLIVKVLDNM